MVPIKGSAKVHIDESKPHELLENRVSVPKVPIGQQTTKVPIDESKYNDIENGGEEIVSDKDIILPSCSITHSEWVKKYCGCDYPIFTDEINKEFRLFGRSSVIPNNFLPITIVYAVQTICRYGLPGKKGHFSVGIIILILISMKTRFSIISNVSYLSSFFQHYPTAMQWSSWHLYC